MKFLALLLLIGCGKPLQQSGAVFERETSDAILRPFLDTFLDKALCFDTPLHYSSLRLTINWSGMSVAGTCTQYSGGSALVVIDGPTWVSINDVNRERLVYHELGHCALNLNHIDQDLEPELMIPIIREAAYTDYVNDYDYIIKSLFSHGPTDCSFEFQTYTTKKDTV